MRKPDEPAPQAYDHFTLPSSGAPPTKPSKIPHSTPSSTATTPAATPSTRPIKPLVSPSAHLAKATSHLPVKTESSNAKPVSQGESSHATPSSVKQDLPRKVLRPPSPVSSHVSSGNESEDDSQRTEEDSEFEDDMPTPRKSPKRSTAKVLDEFKCASLSSSVSVTKPSRITTASVTQAERQPSSSSAAASTFTFPRKPSAATTSSIRPSFTPTPSSSAPRDDVNSRKRKAAPTKYDYFDLSDDDAAAVADDDDDDYAPSQRPKATALPKAVAGKDRRHSSST